jgi:plasmid stabilization system protein ParE
VSKKTIIWSPKAVNSLEQLIAFIEHKWTNKVADNLLNEIEEVIGLIEHNPKIYPLFSHKKQLRKCTIKRRTLLFYREKANRIEVVL